MVDLLLELFSLLDPIMAKLNHRLAPYQFATDNVPSRTGRQHVLFNCGIICTKVCTPARVLCVIKFPFTKQFLADSQ